MKILSAIKSMSPPASPVTPNAAPLLFEAGQIVSKVIQEFVVRRKADASDTLRALLSKPENGELLDKNTQIKEGDIIVIAPQAFREGFEGISPHGMIINVTSVWPVTFDAYEMALSGRNEHTIFIGHPVQTRHPNIKMHFTISPQVSDERVVRYIQRYIAAGYAYRLKVCPQEVYIGAMQAAEYAEKSRQKLSKSDNCTTSAYYGIARCNNYVYNTVVRALEVRNNGNN